MLIKFGKQGTGSGARAISYLLQERDHKEEIRAGIKVLRGNPERVAQLIDSLDFVHRYSSGVIAWHPDDEPSDDEVNEVIDEFEKLAFAGLDKNQYEWTVIEHVDQNGTKHLHPIAAKVELSTGKSLNIAPPGWKKTYGNLVDYCNAKYGWIHPGDPERARDLQPGHAVYQQNFSDLTDDNNVIAALDTETSHPKMVLTDMLQQRVAKGIVQNRADIIRELSALGEITRQGKNYISVKLDGESRAIRFKGELFDEQFDATRLERSDETEEPRRSTAAKRANEREQRKKSGVAAAARQRINDSIKRRSKHNRKKYKRVEVSSENRAGKKTNTNIDHLGQHKEIDHEPAQKNPEPVSKAALATAEKNAHDAVDAIVERVTADGVRGADSSSDRPVPATTDSTESAEDSQNSPGPRQYDDGFGAWRANHSADRKWTDLDSNKNGVNIDEHKKHQTIEADRTRDYFDREVRRWDRARRKTARTADRFIERAKAVIYSCQKLREAADRAVQAVEPLIEKLRAAGGLIAWKQIKNARRAYEKHGKFWEFNRTRKQLTKRASERKRADVREVHNVRTLLDQKIQPEPGGSLSD